MLQLEQHLRQDRGINLLVNNAGLDATLIPAEMVMEVRELVDAALSGFDQGELITLP